MSKPKTKGVVLAGGNGSRLYPLTKGVNKSLLPVYDEPMIHYPIRAMVDAGIDEILVVTSPHHSGSFMSLLGDGSWTCCGRRESTPHARRTRLAW